jgi:hypothetical protein
MLLLDGADLHLFGRVTSIVRTARARMALGPALVMVLPVLLLAGGCESLTLTTGTDGAAPAPVATTTTAALAPIAGTGAMSGGMMTDPATGQVVRVQRSYFAASGRECRELMTGAGVGERSSLVCQDGEGWTPSRPLLRGGGSTSGLARP